MTSRTFSYGRGRRGALFASVAVIFAALLFLAACGAKPEASQLYHCPMHPDYVSDKPGNCPICGMTLVPLRAAAPKAAPGLEAPRDAGSSTGPARQHREIYTCPMHPDVEQDKPGSCPICGMDLVKKEGAPAAAAPKDDGASTGLPVVQTESGQAAAAGVRSVVAVTDSVVRDVRAVGTVVPDETRVRHVNTKVGGWVEKLYVNAVGQMVKRGDPLFELFSPELLASQEEYLRARQSAGDFARSSIPEVRKGGEDLASAARRRLELFDVPPDFIGQLERTGKPRRTILFRAPFAGYVSEKTVVEGHRVEPGEDLLTLTDLSRVWVAAQLYEAEANAAQVGRAATVTLPYDAATALKGRVSLVYPTIEAESRTIKVRLEFPNPRLLLKPGMFVNVALEASRFAGIVVPDAAVIDSGTRQVVFVESAAGRYEPRDVQVAVRSEGKAVLSAGVHAGERVAAAANFLLDSESRLRGTGSRTAPAPPPAGASAAGHKH